MDDTSRKYVSSGITPNDYTETPLFQVMKPFFFTMKLHGMYFCKRYAEFSDENLKSKCPVTWSFIFSTLVVSTNWIMFVKLIPLLVTDFEFGTTGFTRTILTVWVLLCSINSTSCWLGCYRMESLPRFFIEWHEVQNEFADITTCLR